MAGGERVSNLHKGLAMLKGVADALFHATYWASSERLWYPASNSASLGARMQNTHERRGIPRSQA
jgi:hypothetical protein